MLQLVKDPDTSTQAMSQTRLSVGDRESGGGEGGREGGGGGGRDRERQPGCASWAPL